MFGERLKALRLAKGLSQQALANRLSVVRQTVSKWEKELSLPDSDMLLRLAEVLGVSAGELLGEPVAAVAEEPEKPRRPRVWEIVLLALGSPVWLSLLIAALAVVLSLYAAVWAVLVSLWAVFASLIGGALGGVAGGAVLVVGNVPAGVALMAAGLVCAGLSIFLLFGCVAATKAVVTLTKKAVTAIYRWITKREGAV